MKYILSLFILIAFALQSNAQVQYREGYMIDTLTNAETSYLYPGDAVSAASAGDFKEWGALELVIISDSLSGSTAGTVTLQYCYDDACTYTYDAATLTLNGATQQVSRTEDTEFNARKFRLKSVTTGTQSTHIRVAYSWKRRV